jgi:exodeoxyribonuclease III
VRVIAWNVNGIRSGAKKGLLEWMARESPDILALQETRIDTASLTLELRNPLGYHAAWTFPKRKGYSGVATFSRTPPASVHDRLGKPKFDDEGRFVATEFAHFILFNVYFPKGSGLLRDNSRVPYKLAFYDALFAHVRRVKRQLGKPVIVAGDFNTAHREIDLKNWRSNRKNSGFLPEERAKLEQHLTRGFVDIYRERYPEREQYTWWSQRIGVREKNIGWRIDYLWISEELRPHVVDAFILDQVRGSDHCPVGIHLEF